MSLIQAEVGTRYKMNNIKLYRIIFQQIKLQLQNVWKNISSKSICSSIVVGFLGNTVLVVAEGFFFIVRVFHSVPSTTAEILRRSGVLVQLSILSLKLWVVVKLEVKEDWNSTGGSALNQFSTWDQSFHLNISHRPRYWCEINERNFSSFLRLWINIDLSQKFSNH